MSSLSSLTASRPRNRPVTLLRCVLVVAVAESFVHYLDNTLRFSDYTGNDPPAVTSWISRWMIPVSWVLFTAAAVMGYRHFRQGHFPAAAAYLGVYSLSGLISIGHYLGVSISDLSVFQNVFVFLDIALGVIILVFAIWTARQAGTHTRAAPA
ncbi:MAG TPA: hypothetical protein VGO03_13160 [Acidimicrobiia bacterium]|jgi:ABC-type transport system involved in cytochrome c biogenesis permease subunit